MITQLLVVYLIMQDQAETGDIQFTTVGHASADTYTVILQVRLRNYS